MGLKEFSNLPGWRTKRKLVVFESDDWGSVRMPSKVVFDKLIDLGFDLASDDGFRYNKYDSLATTEDLTSLFDTLSKIKDCTGRPAVITPVANIANPDFEKIRQSGFVEYFYEPFTKTLKAYPGCEDSFKQWKVGIENRLFVPQFHGREHLNVKVWMKSLKEQHEDTREAFEMGMWGITTANYSDINVEYQAAFDFLDLEDLKYHKEVIISGLDLFESLFGYRASYFVPPNGPFSSTLESVCSKEGITLLSAPKLQIEPIGMGRSRKHIHWTGQKNKSGLLYLNRNCFFEPGEPGRDWVDHCLSEIEIAFKWKKPAVISSHRVNFIGALHPKNRDIGLKQLAELLEQITKNWPEAEFVTTGELGIQMNNE